MFQTLLFDLILLMSKVTRIVGELLSEINFLTEMVEAGKEVITPTHEMGTSKVIEASLALGKAREETPLKTVQVCGHAPSKPTTLVFRTRIPKKAQVSLPMDRISHNTINERSLM